MKGILFGGIFHSVLALSFGFSSYSAMALDSKNFKKRPKVIYGQDDRMEAYQVSAPGLVTAMNATVAMIPTANLTLKENLFEISQSTLGESMELCKEEPFYNQPTAANCTGFLVGPDLVATAGHCVNEFNCSFQSFVFNYRMQDQNVPPTNLAQNDVYSCKEVVARGYSRNQDYALVRLDRTVVDREP
ncbi:MAG: trypsin-like serine protease, partial [Bdellovibrionaceae bacterium]|nr:trypsin-like serine protease [Pseudobdellovibrionaceae bacterium]